MSDPIPTRPGLRSRAPGQSPRERLILMVIALVVIVTALVVSLMTFSAQHSRPNRDDCVTEQQQDRVDRGEPTSDTEDLCDAHPARR